MIALLACAPPSALAPTDTACTTPLEWHEDRDGDGFGGEHLSRIACVGEGNEFLDGTDCDDDDPAVFPDAIETCNGIDDDCDGSTDENATDAVTWCTDEDGDRHGGTERITQCGLDTAVPCDDCDDTDSKISPSRWEVCDDADADENCDGLADGEDASGQFEWYLDEDGDGYGSGDALESCETVVGHTRTDGDCDDSDPTVHPDADEICDDELDQDCDERIDELCNENHFDLDRAHARFAQSALGEDVIFADMVAAVGDVTGDSVDDFILTAPVAYGDGVPSAFVFDGTASGDLDTDAAVAQFSSYGVFVAAVGDVDGDGLEDISNSSPFAGTVDLHRPPLIGTIGHASAWSTLTAPGAGALVHGAGDLDGDGRDDLLVASHHTSQAVYQATGVGPGETDLEPLPAFNRVEGDPIEGASAIGTLDDDGDGLAEIFVLLDETLYVVDGPLQGDVSPEDARAAIPKVGPSSPGTYFANAGDWDGDGDDDLAAGGAVLGPEDHRAGAAGALVYLTSAYDGAWAHSTAIGDFDGDSRGDLVVGVAREAELALGYILLAPRLGSVDVEEADVLIASTVRYAEAVSVAVPGDLDGDGADELLISSPHDTGWSGYPGAAWLFRGRDWARP